MVRDGYSGEPLLTNADDHLVYTPLTVDSHMTSSSIELYGKKMIDFCASLYTNHNDIL